MRTRKLNWLRRMPAAGGVLVALGVGAAPALGGTYTLNLSAPSSAHVGEPMIIQASGSNPPDDFFNSWLSIHAIPTSVLSTCPADHNNAFQIASSTYAQGGEVVTNHQREDVDAAGELLDAGGPHAQEAGTVPALRLHRRRSYHDPGDGIAGPERGGRTGPGP
jgi:hypothetical protein